MKFSKEQLQEIIKEEITRYREAEEHPMYAKDDELKDVGTDIANLLEFTEELKNKMHEMGGRYGEMTSVGTYANQIFRAAELLSEKFNNGMNNLTAAQDRGWYDK